MPKHMEGKSVHHKKELHYFSMRNILAQYVANSSERLALNDGLKTYHPTLHNRKKQCPTGRVLQYRVGSGIGQNTGVFFGVFRISTKFTLGARSRDKNAIFNVF